MICMRGDVTGPMAGLLEWAECLQRDQTADFLASTDSRKTLSVLVVQTAYLVNKGQTR